MPTDGDDALNPERPPEISPEAFEMLRKAAVPSPFKDAVRVMLSRGGMVRPVGLEGPVVASEIERAALAFPLSRMPIEPEEEPDWTEETAGVEQERVEWPDEEAFAESEGEEPLWPEEPADVEGEEPDEMWEEEPDEVVEEEPEDGGLGPFTLTDVGLDMSGVMHWTPGLHTMEDHPLTGLVTNTYSAFDETRGRFFQEDDDEEFPGEEITFRPEPPDPPPCVFCVMILIFGKSQRYNGTSSKYETSDKALQAAHDAAASFYEAQWASYERAKKRGGKKTPPCVRLVHADWRKKKGKTYRYPGEKKPKGTWSGLKKDEIKEWVNAKDAQGRTIDCFSHVLAIYHGEKDGSTLNVLNWLNKNCDTPIRNLFLWSCWGSEKIDVTEAKMKAVLKQMQAKFAKKAPAHCKCNLCLFTAAPMMLTDVKKSIEAELKRLREKQEKRATAKIAEKIKAWEGAQKQVQKRLKDKKDKDTEYAVPLGIDEDTRRLQLLVPEKKLLSYCPLDLKKGKRGKVRIKDQDFFPGLTLERDLGLMAKALKKGKQKK